MHKFAYYIGMPEQYLSVAEAARYLGSHPDTLRRWDAAGILTAERGPGGHRRYSTAQLDKFKAEGGQQREFERSTKTSPLAYKQVDFNSATIPNDKEFTDLVYDLCEQVAGYTECSIPDGTGDMGLDIVGYARGRGNKRLRVYIQCKRVRDLTKSDIEAEVKKLYQHVTQGALSPPDILIYATSTQLSAGVQTELSKLAAMYFPTLKDGKPVFWGPRELSAKLLRNEQLRNKHLFAEGMQSGELVSPPGSGKVVLPQNIGYLNSDSLEGDSNTTDVLEQELKRAAQLIELGELDSAHDNLLVLKGKLNENLPKQRLLLSRVYNNLGVCLLSKFDPEQTTKAIEFLNQSLDYNPGLTKAKANLALAYIRVGTQDATDKAARVVADFPSDKDALEDPQPMLAYLNVIEKAQGPKEAVEAYQKLKEDKRAKDAIENLGLQQYLAFLFLGAGDTDQARIFADRVLDDYADDEMGLYASALIDLEEAKKGVKFHRYNFVPEFKRYDLIERAGNRLFKAYQLTEKSNAGELRAALYHNWQICNASLWNYQGIELPPLEAPKGFSSDGLIDIQESLNVRDFAQAYEKGLKLIEDSEISGDDTFRLAESLLYFGSPEYAFKALQLIEKDAEQISKPTYWQLRSMGELLLGNMPAAVEASSKAVKLAEDTGKESVLKSALSHHGAILLRDPKDSDRMLQTMLKYDEHFPEDKSIQKLNFEESKDEIIKQFEQRREWADRITEQYKKNPIPSYALEKIMKKPYIEIWAGRGSIMPIEFTYPDPSFEKDTRANLTMGPLVLDYIALLTLSKLNMLGFLERLGVPFAIHARTFAKLQEELLQVENSHLRKVWNFVRKTQEIQIIPYDKELSRHVAQLKGHFDEWLLQTLELSVSGEYILFTDDFRLLRSANQAGAKTTNSMALLREAVDRGWIDKKGYSVAIGELAELAYTFLPYDSSDLHEIVWRDDYKLTLKSYHLISELHLPGSTPESFLGVYINFIGQLWKTGALSEDKLIWLGYLTEQLLNSVTELQNEDKSILLEQKESYEEIVKGMGLMWGTAIRLASREDLEGLADKAKEMLQDTPLKPMIKYINEFSDNRKQQLDILDQSGDSAKS